MWPCGLMHNAIMRYTKWANLTETSNANMRYTKSLTPSPTVARNEAQWRREGMDLSWCFYLALSSFLSWWGELRDSPNRSAFLIGGFCGCSARWRQKDESDFQIQMTSSDGVSVSSAIFQTMELDFVEKYQSCPLAYLRAGPELRRKDQYPFLYQQIALDLAFPTAEISSTSELSRIFTHGADGLLFYFPPW